MQVAKLRACGKSCREIGQLVGVSHVTIVKDLRAIESDWQRDYCVVIEKQKAELIASLKMVRRLAGEAYLRSCEDYVEVTRKGEGTGTVDLTDGDVIDAVAEITEKRRAQAGECSFLSEIRHCNEAIAKILGVTDKPAQHNTRNSVNINNLGGHSLRVAIDSLTTEQIEVLVALHENANSMVLGAPIGIPMDAGQ